MTDDTAAPGPAVADPIWKQLAEIGKDMPVFVAERNSRKLPLPSGGVIAGEETCPDCGRPKAITADDCANGACPKWRAVRDQDAADDCIKFASSPFYRQLCADYQAQRTAPRAAAASSAPPGADETPEVTAMLLRWPVSCPLTADEWSAAVDLMRSLERRLRLAARPISEPAATRGEVCERARQPLDDREIEWRDSNGLDHWVSVKEARRQLQAFYEEWPGGMDEIESCWTNHKKRADIAESRLAALTEERDRLRLPPDETVSDHPGCCYCMEAGTPVRPGQVCPECGDRLPSNTEYWWWDVASVLLAKFPDLAYNDASLIWCQKGAQKATLAKLGSHIDALTADLERARGDALPAEGFYLQDRRSFVGNDMLWWKKDGNGYTTDLRKAHVFTEEEFRKGASRETDVFWPVAYINGISRPTVDHQHAKRKDAALPSSRAEES